jgi:hypothetical protein
MAESATIVLRTVTDEAEENIEDVQAELRDLEDQAEETDDSLNMDPDTTRGRKSMRGLADDVEDVGQEARSSRRALERLGRTDAEPDVDVDRNRRGRLPGELDEVQEAFTFISNLRTEAVLAGGAIATLTAGLVGAGGLSAAALQAANNTTILNDEMAQLKARGRETAREFAQEFAPVLRSDVLPALNRVLGLVEETDSALANFVSDTFDTLQALEQIRESGALGRGLIGGPFAAIPGDQPFVPDGFGLSTLLKNLPEEGEVGVGGGAAAQIENAILKVQTRLEKATDRFELEELFGLPTEERLNDQISTLEKLRDKLIETLAAVDQSEAPPGAVAKINQRIQDLLDRLEKARGELRSFRLEQQVGGVGGASQVTPAGLATPGIGETIRQAGLAGSARELGRTGLPSQTGSRPQGLRAVSMSLQEIQQEFGVSEQKAKQFKQTAESEMGSLINATGQLGQALVGVFKDGEKSAQDFFAAALQGVGGLLSAIPGVGSIAGPLLGQVGGLVRAFDSGGTVNTPLQVVGESGPELAALPQGTQVVSNSESQQMVQNALQGSTGGDVLAAKLEENTRAIKSLQLTADSAGLHLATEEHQKEIERTGARMYPSP